MGIPRNSEMDLQKASATVGPISVGIDAHLPTFHFYKSGVYHDPKCSSVHLDHGVLVVGYGTEQSNGKGKDYWLVKNSWERPGERRDTSRWPGIRRTPVVW